MKNILKFVAIAIFAAFASTSLLAQSNPLLGTWKLNTAKSKSDPTPVPKSMTRTVEETSDGTKYTMKGEAADGTPISYGFTVKFDGKDYPATGNMPGGADSISLKKVDANHYTAVLKKAGKEVGTSKLEISKDGKVATITSKGMTADGKPMHSVSVYDKQ
ncbi:MAG TPA: hypothetical protein VGF61_04535 [Candidatus Acidoferrum sp.]|jgi:hypothetical protein